MGFQFLSETGGIQYYSRYDVKITETKDINGTETGKIGFHNNPEFWMAKKC